MKPLWFAGKRRSFFLEHRCAPETLSIAVIGGGIAGLSAAWLLSGRHRVALYEREMRIGGHANTREVIAGDRSIPVDTGFIVFNEKNYPNFTALLDHLGVPSEESCMSFGVSMDDGAFEYCGRTLSSVFAARRNLISPRFHAMLCEIPRFHRDAREVLRGDGDELTLGEFLEARNYGGYFRERFLKPFAGAIWSTPSGRVFDQPARAVLSFFQNHGLLRVLNLPVWNTVSGGSRSYVEKLSSRLGDIRRRATGVRRDGDHVIVSSVDGSQSQFDRVVIATHADEAAALIQSPVPEEAKILAAFQYERNACALHLDESLMPTRRRAWASWNYVERAPNMGSVTYWMNRLQNLDAPTDIFVTLNPPPETLRGEAARIEYRHPIFNRRTFQAQSAIGAAQGLGGVYYAGSYLGDGFHEDALQAGLAAAEAIGGVARPWSVENPSSRLRYDPSDRHGERLSL